MNSISRKDHPLKKDALIFKVQCGSFCKINDVEIISKIQSLCIKNALSYCSNNQDYVLPYSMCLNRSLLYIYFRETYSY